jgi:hypothetical protein
MNSLSLSVLIDLSEQIKNLKGKTPLSLIGLGLKTIADGHNFPFKISPPDWRGEYSFSGNNGDKDNVCEPFGADLAALLSKVTVRTGVEPLKSDVCPTQGWVLISYLEAEKLIHIAASPVTKRINGAFNIPAINNHQEALAIHLGINSDNADELRQIKMLTINEAPAINGVKVHSFQYQGETYTVTSFGPKVKAQAVVNYNSNLWAVNKES